MDNINARILAEAFINSCSKLSDKEELALVVKKAQENVRDYQWGLAMEDVLFYLQEHELRITQEIFDLGKEAIRKGALPKENKETLIYLKNLECI